MASELQKLGLGQKIRKLRESMGQTSDEFAKGLDLPPSLLKQIEKNEISPPIATLLNIAHYAGRELGYFFDVATKDKIYTVVRKGRAQAIKRVLPKGKNPLSYSYKILASEKATKQMEPLLVDFLVRKEVVPQVAHDGEEFIYVLAGRLEFRLRDKKIQLNSGDSLYFESKYPHSFRAMGNRPAKALVVLYPH